MNPARKYLEAKVHTASQEELFLMLFDGAIRFCEQALTRFPEPDPEPSNALLIRAQKVVLELVSCLKREDMPGDVYKALADLYDFVYNRLVRANLDRKPEYVGDAVKILAHLRDTWAGAIEKNRELQFPALKTLKGLQESAPVGSAPLSFEG